MRNVFLCLAGAILLAGCGTRATGVNAERLSRADREPGQWLSIGRTLDEQRHSPLTQINADNVARLGLAWHADLDTNRGQEASPLVIDGVLYVSTAWSKVLAFDAASGKPLWSHDPAVPREWGARGCCDVVNRGVAAWGDNIFVGTYDGRLVALDAATGKVRWETNTIDRDQPYTITGAPRVVKGKVLIGNGGAELGVRGYISAYDAKDGTLLWRFFTVPGNPANGFENPQMEMAAKTWKGAWWTLGGGGTVWDAMAYDEKLNLLYIGVGNGSPWNQAYRSPGGGDNLFLSSIVALNPDDGSYVWHYQTTPGETWDYTATQHIIVADLPLDEGKSRRVVMQAPKNGFFYVLDAATGKLLSAEKFTRVNWATHVDLATGRPVERLEARYDKTGQPSIIEPSAQGAHSWHPMSFSPRTGLVYLPLVETSMSMVTDPNYKPRFMAGNTGTGRAPPDLYDTLKSDAPRQSSAFLSAWDAVTQREVWRSAAKGRVGSGVLSTAGGLVFQGSPDGEFAAYRDSNGEKLWSFDAQTGVVAAPVSYEVNGQQYVAQLAGYGTRDYYTGNRSRLLVFRLDATATLPQAAPPPPARTANPPPAFGTPQVLAQGEEQYTAYCAMCHETGYGNRGLFPDLRVSPMINSAEAFRGVVIDGALQPRGMVSFRDRLDAGQAEAIRAYLVRRAHDLAAASP
jgi:PQQ-dependent dehydrogenase (methanol/ethanol family)